MGFSQNSTDYSIKFLKAIDKHYPKSIEEGDDIQTDILKIRKRIISSLNHTDFIANIKACMTNKDFITFTSYCEEYMVTIEERDCWAKLFSLLQKYPDKIDKFENLYINEPTRSLRVLYTKLLQ